MGKVVLLVGISGAGKSTLLEKISASATYTLVNLGTIMFEIAKSEGIVSTRDQIKKLKNYDTSRLRDLAFQKIGKEQGNLLIDTHISIENSDQACISPGIPIDLLSQIKPAGLIYIDAPSTDILERRLADTSRSRENQTVSALDTQRIIDLSLLSYYMAYLNIPLYIIINKQGRFEEAATSLKKALATLFDK